MTDRRAPERYTLTVNGRGRPGFVNGSATLTLTEADGGAQTRVDVAGRAQVGGTIARFGQRLLGGRLEDDDGPLLHLPAGARGGASGA